MRNKKGITLIFLVITIIVLLILAGVSLSLIAGENGILGRATKAVDQTEIAGAKEEAELLVSDFGIEFYEKKYVDGQSGLGEIDTYIEGQFSKTGEETAGGYSVTITAQKVEVKKEGKIDPIATGALEDGKIIWGKEPTPRLTLASVTDANIGDYIDLGNNIVGTDATTDDWRIFYKDGDNVYVILADFLLNETGYAEKAGLKRGSNWWSVGSSISGNDLINGLNHETAWNGLANGISGASVKGTPTYEQLKTSWNSNSKVNNRELSEIATYHDNLDDPTELYIPYKKEDHYDGYWLASIVDSDSTSLWMVNYIGGIYDNWYYSHNLSSSYDAPKCGVRPIVSLPSNTTVEYDEVNGLWTVL